MIFLKTKPNFIKRLKNCVKEKFLDFSENITNFIEEIGTLIPVFEPDRPFRFSFDLLMLIYLIALIADNILKFGFEFTENNYYPTLWIVLEVMPCWLFLLEALLDVNTAYYSKGNFVANRRQILKNYAQNYLIVDILTICPFFFSGFEGGKFLEMLLPKELILKNGISGTTSIFDNTLLSI